MYLKDSHYSCICVIGFKNLCVTDIYLEHTHYEMELSLDDIHTSLKMVIYYFHLTATAVVNNNRRTSLSSSEAAEAVVKQPLHRDEAVPVAETFLWCLSHGTTNTSASSSPT
jgi:hypothetical protein